MKILANYMNCTAAWSGVEWRGALAQICPILLYKPLLFCIFFSYEPTLITTIKTRATKQNLCVDNETDKHIFHPIASLPTL